MLIYGIFIDSDPKILSGKARIKDTRISVEHILNELAGRMSLEDLREHYPALTREVVSEALAFAAASLQHREILSLEKASSCYTQMKIFH